MSNWAPPPPAEIQRPSRDGCVMVGCGVAAAGTLVLGLAFLAGVWWLFRLNEEQRQARLGPPPPLVERTSQEFQTEVASGFRQEQVGVDAGTLKSIERFFREASRVRDKQVESREVRRLIDGRRALAEIERSPNCVKLLPADKTALRSAPFGHNPFSQAGPPLRIVHVELREQRQEAVVWGYFPDADGDPCPMRWWLVRGTGGWKLFNWEDSDSGRSEVDEIAVMMSLSYRAPQAWESYNKLAIESIAIGEGKRDYFEAKKWLESCDTSALDERVFDDGVMRVAFAHYHVGQYDRCLALCDLVKRPQIRPDVERTRTYCFQHQQRWQETAQAAERYERLIGPTPAVLTSLARSLAHLSRPQEAEQVWRRVLAVKPDDHDALAGWGEVLPESRKRELVERVSTLPNSQRHAQQLVQHFCAREDDATARLLADWLAKEAPDSLETLEAAAELKNFDEEHVAAAELYLAAHGKATSDEQRTSLQYSYLAAMAAADKQIEAHAKAPNRRAALEAYWWDYMDEGEYGLTRQHLRSIVQQHKKSDPQDPLAAEIEADLLARESRYAEAEQVLQGALAHLARQPDAERQESLKRALVDALLNQGKWTAAFAQRPKDFDIAAVTQQWLAAGRLAETKTLVEHFQRASPAEPSLYLCRAELLLAERKYAEAWNALPPTTLNAVPDHARAWRLNQLVGDLVIKDESSLPRFVARSPDNNQWDALAGNLHTRNRWETLAKAVEIWRNVFPAQPELLYWDAIVKSHAQDHAAVAALLAEPLASPATEQFDYRRRELHLLLVESLLALGKAEAAREHGQRVRKEEKHDDPLLLALLGAGDVAGLKQTAAAASAGQNQWYGPLPYHQPRFAPLLTEERFLPLRQSHPPAVEYGYLEERVTLLLAGPQPPSAAEVQQRLTAALPGASFKLLASAESSSPIQTLEARRGDDRWLINIGSQPYASRERLAELPIHEPPLREAVTAHRCWIEIGRDDDQKAAHRSLDALASALAPPPGSVVHLQSVSRLMLWDEALARRLEAAAADDELTDVGEPVYLYSENEEPSAVGRRAWREFQRKYRQRGANPKPFRVLLTLSLGEAREQLWFSLTRLEADNPWRPTIVGTAESNSLLHPSLKAGEPRQIERYRVLAIDPAE